MRRRARASALLTWALWLLVLVAIVVTYARLDPADLYHISREGLAGGLSRALVVANFPLSLVAIALVLVAVDVLPRRAWLAGGPAIALCAVTAWPGVVDQADLDARPVNAYPRSASCSLSRLRSAPPGAPAPGSCPDSCSTRFEP